MQRGRRMSQRGGRSTAARRQQRRMKEARLEVEAAETAMKEVEKDIAKWKEAAEQTQQRAEEAEAEAGQRGIPY